MTVAVVCGLTYTLIAEFILPLLPKVEAAVNTSPSTGAWLSTAFLLTGIVAGPLVARWCDMTGPRTPMLFCLAAFLVGALICLFGNSISVFIIGRAVQGVGAGMFGVAMALIRTGVRAERIRMGIALVSATLGLGTGIGAILAGIVLEVPSTNYKTVFLISALLAAAALIACFWLVPATDPAQKTRRPLDLPGAVLIGGGLTCAVLVLSKGTGWGWGSATSVGLIAGTVVLLVAWGLYESRFAADPLVDIRLYLAPMLAFTLLAELLTGFATTGVNLGLSQVVQLPRAIGPLPFYGLGGSVLMAGLVLIPTGLGSFAMAPVTARLSKRFGLNPTLVLGPWFVLGAFLFVEAEHNSLWAACVASVMLGTGLGLVYTTSANRWVIAIPRDRISVNYAVVGNFINIGLILSSAIFSSLAASRPAHLPAALHLRLPALSAYTTLWWVCAAGAALAIGCTIAAALTGPGFGRLDVDFVRSGWRMRREVKLGERTEVPAP